MKNTIKLHSIDAHLIGRRFMSVYLISNVLEEDHSRAHYKASDEISWKLRVREDAFVSRWSQKGASVEVVSDEQIHYKVATDLVKQDDLLIFCGHLVYQNAKRAIS